jgi:hypothetical protein
MKPTPNRVESHQPPLKTKEIFTGLNFIQTVFDRLFHQTNAKSMKKSK